MKEKGWTLFATVWATLQWVFLIISGVYGYVPEAHATSAHFLGSILTIDSIFWSIVCYWKWKE